MLNKPLSLRIATLTLAAMALANAAYAAPAANKPPYHDYFYFLGEMNKASTVMVIENKIVPPELGKKIVSAVDQVIKNGYGAMGDYGDQIPVNDRWAIVAYVKALQLSRDATLSDVPVDQRDHLSATTQPQTGAPR